MRVFKNLGMPARLLLALAVLVPVAIGPTGAPAQGLAGGYAVVAMFPHDEEAFTQGLDFYRKRFYEGTGLEGESTLRRVALSTGEVKQQVELADKHFGEGITVLNGRIYQLTWQSYKAFVYRRRTMKRIRTFTYEGEGWGLTHNGRRLVMSNGTDEIVFRNPKTFKIKRTIKVTEDDEEVSRLNELEWIQGEIFANVWPTDIVVRIDPSSGEVTGRLDLSALKQAEEESGDPDVTNGIAYLAAGDRIFVTGKEWAHVYEIELTD